jgi:hypothetical protein
MTSTSPVAMLLGVLIAASPVSAACGWFGTQLECDLAGRQVVVGTQTADEPTYARSLHLQALQGHAEGILDERDTSRSPFRVELQNVGRDPSLCRTIGNETYCY